jgi:DNA polymerase-3 subunit gamma/tau
VAASGPGAIDAAALRRVWPEVMNQVRERNKPTHALLQNATVSGVDGTRVTLGMPTPPLARQLSQPNRADHVSAALGAVLSGQWTVQAVHGTGEQARPAEPRPGESRSTAPRRPDPPRRAERAEQQPGPDGPAASERPARRAVEVPAGRRQAPPSDVPPPPEPPEEGDVTEEDMYAEAAADPGGATAGPRQDPEEAAMELLTSQLGARRVDGR